MHIISSANALKTWFNTVMLETTMHAIQAEVPLSEISTTTNNNMASASNNDNIDNQVCIPSLFLSVLFCVILSSELSIHRKF